MRLISQVALLLVLRLGVGARSSVIERIRFGPREIFQS